MLKRTFLIGLLGLDFVSVATAYVDSTSSKRWVQQLANQGDADAQYELAIRYYGGYSSRL